MSPPIYTHIYTHIYILEGKERRRVSPLWPSVSSRLIQPDEMASVFCLSTLCIFVFLFSPGIYIACHLGSRPVFSFSFFCLLCLLYYYYYYYYYILYKLALSPSFLFSRLYQRTRFVLEFRSMSSFLFSTHRRRIPPLRTGTLKKERR